jgi:hypothetical protein
MKPHALFIAALVLAACESADAPRGKAAPPPAASEGAPRVFGAALRPATVLPLGQVLAEPASFANKNVTVEGKVRRNCTAKGCWMELAEGFDKSLQGCRVTFQDYGFFVPLDSAGSTARVQGTVSTEQVSPAQVEHLEGEGATFKSKQPDGSATEVRIVATGVELFRGT